MNAPLEVLLVDDDPLDLAIVTAEIRRMGGHVTQANNAEEALEILRGGTIDICVSDWFLPGMDGVELGRQAKNLAGGKTIYFLLLTANTDRQSHLEALEAGADDVLVKSWEPAALACRFLLAKRVVALYRRIEALQAHGRLPTG